MIFTLSNIISSINSDLFPVESYFRQFSDQILTIDRHVNTVVKLENESFSKKLFEIDNLRESREYKANLNFKATEVLAASGIYYPDTLYKSFLVRLMSVFEFELSEFIRVHNSQNYCIEEYSKNKIFRVQESLRYIKNYAPVITAEKHVELFDVGRLIRNQIIHENSHIFKSSNKYSRIMNCPSSNLIEIVEWGEVGFIQLTNSNYVHTLLKQVRYLFVELYSEHEILHKNNRGYACYFQTAPLREDCLKIRIF